MKFLKKKKFLFFVRFEKKKKNSNEPKNIFVFNSINFPNTDYYHLTIMNNIFVLKLSYPKRSGIINNSNLETILLQN